MTDKKISKSCVVLTLIVLVCLAVIGFQAVEIKQLESSQFTFSPGESFPKLELLNLDNTPFIAADISQGVTLIYCFKAPYSACNSNLNTWNRIAQYFKGRVNILGIITNGNMEAAQQLESRKVDFQIFLPVNEKSFKRKIRLIYNIAQTIIIHDNKVISVKPGTLTENDLKSVLSIIKTKISSH